MYHAVQIQKPSDTATGVITHAVSLEAAAAAAVEAVIEKKLNIFKREI